MSCLVKAGSSVHELLSFAVLLKAAGLGRREVTEVFQAARYELPDEDVKTDDSLCDALDFITGFCSPGTGVFPEDNTPAYDPPN